MDEDALRIRTERATRGGRAATGTAGRASRRARVAKSRQAETHDHDHDHDHDHGDAEDVVEVETTDEVEAEPATLVDVADDAESADDAAEAGSGDIKGNQDSMKYHVPGSQWYDQTEAEVWFETVEEAEAAGYEPAGGAAKQEVDDAADTDEKDED